MCKLNLILLVSLALLAVAKAKVPMNSKDNTPCEGCEVQMDLSKAEAVLKTTYDKIDERKIIIKRVTSATSQTQYGTFYRIKAILIIEGVPKLCQNEILQMNGDNEIKIYCGDDQMTLDKRF